MEGEHKISTIEDILNCTNSENVEKFINDFRACLITAIEFKEKFGTTIKEIKWIDDGIREVSINICR